MANKKHLYKIVLNSEPHKTKCFTYSFGRTENIKLYIEKNKALIEFYMGRPKDTDRLFTKEYPLFADAVKKIMLVHMIRYSCGMNIKNIYGYEDDEQIHSETNSGTFIFSLVKGKLIHKVPDEWQNDNFIESLLNTTKSKYDARISSLFAMLCSKAEEYETTRFLYLFMSLNGIYNYLYGNIFGLNIKKDERAQLKTLARCFGLKTDLIEHREEDTIFYEIRSSINKYDDDYENVTFDSLSGRHSRLAEDICSCLYHRYSRADKKLDFKKQPHLNKIYYNLDAGSYFITELAYYYRCKIFHANNPLMLFSFEEESEIKILKVMNGVLESFVEKIIPLWFDSDYIENEILPQKDELLPKDDKK